MKIKLARSYLSRIDFLFLVILFFHSSLIYANEKPKRFQVDIMSELSLAGDLNINEDVLIGAELKYFLFHSGSHHPYVSAAIRTDVDKDGNAWDIWTADIGSQYDLPTLWGKRTYLEYAGGIVYSSEEISVELIDRTSTSTFDEVDFKASLGVGLDFNERIGSKLYVNQYGDIGTSLGLSLNYSF